MTVIRNGNGPTPDELNRLVALFQAGRHGELEAQARQLLEHFPEHGFGWKLLSAALHLQGKDSFPALQKAVEYLPQEAELHSNLGNVLRERGETEQAVSSYRRALELNPGLAEAHYNLGVALKDLGLLEMAEESYRRALDLKPDYAEAWNNLGIAQMELGRPEEAVSSYRQVIGLQPGHALAHNNLGNSLQALGRYEEAVASYRRALELKPDYPEAHRNLGNVLRSLGRMQEAVASFRRALALREGAETHYSLGLALHDIGLLEEASESYRRALAIRPDYAEAHLGLAFNLLMKGELERGWREYEWRRQCSFGQSYVPDPCKPGTLLRRPSSFLPVGIAGKRFHLLGDQGIGDELFFLRFVPGIRQRGGWVAYSASSKLKGLLARSAVLDRVLGQGDCLADVDHVFLASEAPLVLGMKDGDALPPPIPLSPLPDKLAGVRQRLAAFGDGPCLGVTWWAGTRPPQGAPSSRYEKVQYREISCQELAAHLRQWPGPVVVLQRSPAEGEVERFAAALGRPVMDFSSANDDLEEMLALLSLLDEHVGVANTNMHLSAGLGKPCRVLLPRAPEWRWIIRDGMTPWFPGFRPYCQSLGGSWREALTSLENDLMSSCG